MKKAFIIAEKPSLLKKILSAYKNHRSEFDFELEGVAQVGHLFGLKMPSELDEEQKSWEMENFPWFPKKWEYKLTKSDAKFARSKSDIFKEIKEALHSGKYDFVINAGDPDQEGELLVRETLHMANNTLPVRRLWINASTEEEFVTGLKNLEPNSNDFFENMYQAALTRQHSDYLIGMNFSPIVKIKTGESSHVGRLKTFIVSLITAREEEIRNWKPSSQYEVIANYKEGFSGAYKELFKTKEEANDFLSELSDTAKVISAETKRTKQTAPALFKLSTLQIAAAKKGYSADDVQQIAQSLYDKEYLSYPRTSCEYINDKANFEQMLKSAYVFESLQPFIDKITSKDIENVKKNKKYVKNDVVAESGHCALTPTGKLPDLSKLSEEEKEILHLVYIQYVAIFLPPLIQDKTKIITENNGFEFITNGKTLIDKGYTNLLTADITDKPLPVLHEEDIVHTDKENDAFNIVEKKAVCPKRYTDGTLIEALENPAKYITDKRLKGLGKILNISIGQPSTRAPILLQLVKLGYLQHTKGKGSTVYLSPTEKGVRNAHNLSESSLCKADTTAAWEEKLEQIRKGKLKREQFEAGIKEMIIKELTLLKAKKMETYGGLCKCFHCGNTVIEKKLSYTCLGCRATIWKKSAFFDAIGKSVTEKTAKELLENGKVFLKGLTSKKGTKYDAWIKVAVTEKGTEFKMEFDRELIGKCPRCGKNVYATPKAFSCEDRSCGFALWKNDKYLESIGKTLTTEMAKDILKTGKTKLVNAKSAKTGKTFNAVLNVDFSEQYPKYNLKF